MGFIHLLSPVPRPVPAHTEYSINVLINWIYEWFGTEDKGKDGIKNIWGWIGDWKKVQSWRGRGIQLQTCWAPGTFWNPGMRSRSVRRSLLKKQMDLKFYTCNLQLWGQKKKVVENFEKCLYLRGKKISQNKRMSSCRTDWKKKIVNLRRWGIGVSKRW